MDRPLRQRYRYLTRTSPLPIDTSNGRYRRHRAALSSARDRCKDLGQKEDRSKRCGGDVPWLWRSLAKIFETNSLSTRASSHSTGGRRTSRRTMQRSRSATACVSTHPSCPSLGRMERGIGGVARSVRTRYEQERRVQRHVLPRVLDGRVRFHRRRNVPPGTTTHVLPIVSNAPCFHLHVHVSTVVARARAPSRTSSALANIRVDSQQDRRIRSEVNSIVVLFRKQAQFSDTRARPSDAGSEPWPRGNRAIFGWESRKCCGKAQGTAWCG